MKKLVLILIVLLFFSCTTFASVHNRVSVYNSSRTQNIGNDIKYVDIVIDYSASMGIWVEEAKRAVLKLTSKIPGDVQIGVRTIGGKSDVQGGDYLRSYVQSCKKSTQILPVAYNSAKTIVYNLDNVKLGGNTPLTLGLRRSVNVDFAQIGSYHLKKIILITDGGENCGGDPCVFIRNLITTRKDFVVDVIFTGRNDTSLRCLTDATNGTFYYVNDIKNFGNVLFQSITSSVEPQKTQTQSGTATYGYVFVE